MILAEHRHHQQQQQQSTSTARNNQVNDDESSSNDTVDENNEGRKCQSIGKRTIVEETAVVHQQPDSQRQIVNHDAEEEEDSTEYSSTDDDDEDDDEDDDDRNKQVSMAKRLPAVPQPRVNNQVSNASNVNINNTNKNVYEGSVVIHQTFYNNSAALDRIDVAQPVEKITNGHVKDPELAVGPKLSNVSSHPLYEFEHEEVTSWFTKRRLIVISGAVLVGLVSIILLVCMLIPGAGDSFILGIPYVERTKWVAQPPNTPPKKVQEYPPPYVIISHTATEFCYERGECIRHVRFIQNFHMESQGWDDIAYNFLVGGDGTIYEGRGWDIEGAHTFNYNIKSIGISFIGTFTKREPTAVQVFAAKKLIEYAVQAGKLSKDYKLLGHRQCIKTESPGEKLYQIIKTWPHWSPTP